MPIWCGRLKIPWVCKSVSSGFLIHISYIISPPWCNRNTVAITWNNNKQILYRPCFLSPFTVPCKMTLARSDERETWPYPGSLHFFTIFRRSLCCPIACWIFARTSSLVTCTVFVHSSFLISMLVSNAYLPCCLLVHFISRPPSYCSNLFPDACTFIFYLDLFISPIHLLTSWFILTQCHLSLHHCIGAITYSSLL